MKRIWIGGGNGFIGHHLGRRLKQLGHFVRVVDIQEYAYGDNDYADEIIIGDLRDPAVVEATMGGGFDEAYQLAADMGGAQYVFTGEHDADIMTNSALININVVQRASLSRVSRLFYSSSACVYPQEIQQTPEAIRLEESLAYPANPDSDYGFEKLFSERLYQAWGRNYQMNIVIGRLHNIFGPEGTWYGGKEKAPAAVCRKVAKNESAVENWGDGSQTRSFLFIDDCIDAILAVMEWDINVPVNIGSEELVTIQGLYQMVIDLSGKPLDIVNIPMPEGCLGVWGRNSHNDMIERITGWRPKYDLRSGLEKTYRWIEQQLAK